MNGCMASAAIAKQQNPPSIDANHPNRRASQA